jgi:hypothetical protein
VSSAEWIAEAPSACDTHGRCRQATLTNFGKVAFTKTLGRVGAHNGAVSDPLWTATPIELRSFATFGRFAAAGSGSPAVPTGLSSGGSSFTVAYAELETPTQPDPFAGPGLGF